MVKRSFKVTVDGESFNVEVEEIKKQPQGNSAVQPTKENPKEEATKPPVEKESKPEKPDKQKEEIVKNASEKTVDQPKDDVEGTVISAPMPGAILDVKVKEGDEVAQDDVLLILEAMKMENEITSPIAGKVLQISVAKGASVNSKDKLIVIG